MTSVKDQFTKLTKSEDMEVVLGDDLVVRAVGEGTISFQSESQPPLLNIEVLYVPGLKKNLISISRFEDRGYEMLFKGGQVLMYPKGSRVTSTKVLKVREEKLYRFLFQPVRALAHSTTSINEPCEI